MNEDFKNAEGYLDLTPYEAMKNMEDRTRPPFMPLIYICSPYSSNPEANTKRAGSSAVSHLTTEGYLLLRILCFRSSCRIQTQRSVTLLFSWISSLWASARNCGFSETKCPPEWLSRSKKHKNVDSVSVISTAALRRWNRYESITRSLRQQLSGKVLEQQDNYVG